MGRLVDKTIDVDNHKVYILNDNTGSVKLTDYSPSRDFEKDYK